MKATDSIFLINNKRRAPVIWRNVFKVLSQIHHPKSFYFDEVAEMADSLGAKISPESLRVKLARYSQKGVLKKVGRQEYILTSKGQLFFDLLK